MAAPVHPGDWRTTFPVSSTIGIVVLSQALPLMIDAVIELVPALDSPPVVPEPGVPTGPSTPPSNADVPAAPAPLPARVT